MSDPTVEPTYVTINRRGDIYFEYEARPFIGKKCILLKVTKAGLYMVALVSDTRKVYSFPKSNIVGWSDELCS